MFHHNRMCRWLLVVLFFVSLVGHASIPIKSVVIFGDSMSDTGNTTHLLKSLRQEENPAFIVTPFKAFVINRMIDFAEEYYVPQMVLNAGIDTVTHFFDRDLAPYIVNLIAQVKRVPIVPGAPYWHSRFSNGPVWNEYLAQMLMLNQNSTEVYNNRAFGGSWAATYDYQLTVWNLIRHPLATIKTLIVGKLIPPSLGLSVQAFLMEHTEINSESVYFMFSGNNDYLNALQFDSNYNAEVMSRYIDNVLSNLSTSVNKLAHAGARRFVVMGVPHMGEAPKFINTSDREVLNAVAEQHNLRLKAMLANWQTQYPEADFLFIDMQEYFAKVLINPQQYGFTNTSDACIDVKFSLFRPFNNSPFANNYVLQYAQVLQAHDQRLAFAEQNYRICNAPEDYLFWDEIHPSTRAHHLLAFEICSSMKAHGYAMTCLSPAFAAK